MTTRKKSFLSNIAKSIDKALDTNAAEAFLSSGIGKSIDTALTATDLGRTIDTGLEHARAEAIGALLRSLSV
jgi:hypothetical protein